MGCTQSKIENEEAVSRCKERKLFMKDAVSARNAFAAAHSSYAIYLKNTGAALSDYAQGEVAQHPSQLVQVIHPPNLTSVPAVAVPAAAFESFPPPPPPLPNFPPAPLQRAASMPEIKPDPKTRSKLPKQIIEEEDEDEEIDTGDSLRVRTRSRSRSQSQSQSQSKRGVVETEEEEDEFPDGQPPPSPTPPPPSVESRTVPPLPQQQDTPYDYFFSHEVPASSLEVPAEPSLGREEIRQKVFDERPAKKVERELEPEVVAEVKKTPVKEEEVVPVSAPPPPPVVVEPAAKKKVKQMALKGSINLLKVFEEIDDHFLKASESAHEVSKMLEATRLHYHSNFADNRGHIDHSARVMRVITWNRSFKGIPDFDDGGKDEFDTEEHETHATVLDKLLAWEKKLYDEVKAGELMKFEYQKKVASLNKLKKRSKNAESLEKAKAAVSHLHTRYIVDMQSMDSTVSEISSLRDDQLYPKLVQLVAGMANMWEAMQYHHESQSKIVTALRSFDISQCPKYTTDHHHERTVQLLCVVQEWHSQFVKLVSKQKEYVKALRNWLKLNLIPIESNLKEKVSSPPRIQNPAIQGLLLEWNDYLEKLPDDVARTAIQNFAGIIHTIMLKQEEEMKMKDKCEDSRKELDRKKRQFEDWYHKYMNKNIPDELDPERPESNVRSEVVAEKQFAVETIKKRLEDEEEAYARLCLQVREKSITSLKTGLPELFKALADFAFSCSEMYKHLNSRSTHHQSESSGRQ